MRSTFQKRTYQAQEGGFGVMVLVFFFLILFTTVVIGVSSGVVSDVQDAREYSYSRQAFYAAESGVEDVFYRLNKSDLGYDETEVLSFAGESATTTVQTLSATEKQVISRGESLSTHRNISVRGAVLSGTAFGSAVQAGNGGIELGNSSFVSGDVYANGPVIGTKRNEVNGSVVSAGPDGYIEGIEVAGDAYANEIRDSEVAGDAYYDENITNAVVHGAKHPGSPDQAVAPFPISDATIDGWKGEAEAGGVITSCPYQIKKESVTLGPVKIDCDLELVNSSEILLTGPVWVDGDIEFKNSSIVRVDPSLGENSAMLIADDSDAPNSGGRIVADNSTEFYGSGTDGSYVLLISQNRSAENGGGTEAMTFGNSSEGDVLVYASHGRVVFGNSVAARQITAHTIEMQNSSELIYEEGLSSVIFSGAQGRWGIGNWKEVE